MTVKAIRGRRRYLVFKVTPRMDRDTMIHTIQGGKRFNVIQCAEGRAIVRCAPEEFDECVGAVLNLDPTSSFITMSGTLKTLRDRYPVLKRNASPKPSRSKNKAAPPSKP